MKNTFSAAVLQFRYCAFLTSFWMIAQHTIATGILPSDRIIDWTQAGVPNLDVIRASRTVFTNVTGLDTNGLHDCSVAIQNAINACPSNGIVVLPAGRLVLSNILYISADTINRGGFITLSGSTNGATILIVRGNGAILTGNENFGQSNNIVTAGLLQGTTNISLSSGSNLDFALNDVLQISRQDESATNWVLVYDNAGLTNSKIVLTNGTLVGEGAWKRIGSGDVFKQYVLCTGVTNSTNITFWPPLYLSWTNPPGLYTYCEKIRGASAFVGIENLIITNAAMDSTLIKIGGSYGSWVKNCRLLGYGSPVIMCHLSINCEVRDSDFVQPSANPPGGDVTGLEFNASSAFKAENDTFSGYWEQILMENSASGGVIAYNYFTNEYLAAAATTGYQEPDIYINHEAHDMMNLFEGNVLSQIQADNYHGDSSHNTLFRNWIHGMNNAFGIPLISNVKCIDLCRYSYYYNIVGNIIGNPALSGGYYDAPTNGTFSTASPAMYRLGFPDMGNDCVGCNDVYIDYQGAPGTTVWGYPIAYDPKVTNTIIRLCNYDYVTQGIPDGTLALPASLVYSNAPSWWGNRPWPPFDSTTPGTASTTNVPAGYRYSQRTKLAPPSALRVIAQ